MSAKEIKLEYALSSRASCKGCKLKIEKNQIRLGTETIFQGEHTTWVWRHLECFSLGRKYKDIEPQDIDGYYDLKKEDKVKVINYFEGGGKKKTAVDQIIDTINESEKKVKQKLKGDEEDEEEQEDKDIKKKYPKRRVQNKQIKARSKIDSDSSSDDDEDNDTKEYSQDDQNTDNSGSDSDYEREKILKRKKKPQKKQGDTKKAATKQKGKQKSQNTCLGYTPEQLTKFKEYLEFYDKKTTEYLKGLLSVNNQTKSGSKPELVIKCADGKTLGQIPICSACGGGKLKFDFQTGLYKCPGFMDDDTFQNCGKKFSVSEVKRETWIDDLI